MWEGRNFFMRDRAILPKLVGRVALVQNWKIDAATSSDGRAIFSDSRVGTRKGLLSTRLGWRYYLPPEVE